MLIKTYTCDICMEVFTDKAQLLGIRFTHGSEFQLGHWSKTDGKHICTECARRITNQFSKLVQHEG